MKKIKLITLILFAAISIVAQENKKNLSFDDILKWNSITEKQISNDGNIITYKLEPWNGNHILKIADKTGKNLKTIINGTDAKISENSKFIAFTIKPNKELVRELKLKDTEKDKMLKNKLGILDIKTLIIDTISNIVSYKIPENWSSCIAYRIKKDICSDTSKKNLDKEESDENGYLLNIKNFNTGKTVEFPFVTSYKFAKEKEILSFISTGNNKDFKAGVYYYDIKEASKKEILVKKGSYKQLSINKTADKIAFLADTISDKKEEFSLYYWTNNSETKQIVDNTKLNKDWEISKYGEILFSEKNERIFFGVSPINHPKDTSILSEEVPKLDIWHWNEPVLHSQQLYNKETDTKKSYLSVYHVNNNNIIQLETAKYTDIEIINKGNDDYILAYSNLPYSVRIMWEGYPYHNDFYLIDINTGKAELIKEDCRATPHVSPKGKYLYWYNARDTSWNTFNIKTKVEYKVSSADIIQCADELNDVPNLAYHYGSPGWLKNDEALLVYDRYDIWKINPENNSKPVNLTINGRKNKVAYRYIDFAKIGNWNNEDGGIDLSEDVYLKSHNEITREDAYLKTSFKKPKTPEILFTGKFRLNTPIKAKNAKEFIFTKENFKKFPDLLFSKNEFRKYKKITKANPQQDEFLWGTKELYTWTSLDGKKLEGLLIKPENFDPNKKYPLIVNFYEKSSQELYHHQIPEAHRSTIDYHYYSSNGYVIFNPDVYYKEGYPGEDAFNCVMPGITQLINDGFIDKNSIAAQGHSWGGYQVAYLATRTNLFAAIESGAPVVNMFSAYGGIRLWSGRNRSFQYEKTQSRIGKSIWQAPLRYLENSPLFTVDKIQTPMLIMHNENDGAVPFSQGIEFFIALRRLKKPAWLLNYNEADHWPTIVRDKYDFQIRLAEFFDHYLKEKPMPLWMKEGIPAIEKEKTKKYNIIK
ncbi:MAG: prolyl oligopeptidase family serine peptidase [Bacteroidota bacterium]|nr:prolyl oligopeptidase family serine peptidase [Bacteroidota bacterium]